MRTKILKEVGLKIIKMRNSKNITFEELSQKSGISKKYLKKIEEGVAFGMTPQHLLKICNAFNLTLSEFLNNY